MKGKQMTLKQAETFLKTTDHPFSVVTIRRAAKLGMLKATLIDAPVAYYMVDQDDLMAWACNAKTHQPGRRVE